MSLKIEEMFAFIVEDPSGSGSEGVIAMRTKAGWLPLVGADMDRMNSLKPFAISAAAESGAKLKLVKFANREELAIEYH